MRGRSRQSPRTRLAATGFLFAALVLAGIPASAEAPAAEQLQPELPVNVTADQLEWRRGERRILARGNVRLEHHDAVLLADEAEVDEAAQTFEARGRVVLIGPEGRLEGERLLYNYATGRATISAGRGLVLPATSFTAREIVREDRTTYHLTDVAFTTCAICQTPPYDWEARAGSATLYTESHVVGRHASFWVNRLPILYTPLIAFPVGPRRTGLLIPEVGYSSTEGAIVKPLFFWAISPSQDATVWATYRSERGTGPGLEYRYALDEQSRGSVKTEYLHDRATDEDRYYVQATHRQIFTERLDAGLDLDLRSDKGFPREFSTDSVERTQLFTDSRGALTYAHPFHLAGLSGSFAEQLREQTPDDDERLFRSDLALTSFAQPLFGTPVLFAQESSGSYLDKRDDVASSRLDLHPRLGLPLHLAPGLTWSTWLGGRLTAYAFDRRAGEDGDASRELLDVASDLTWNLGRTYRVDALRVAAVRHLIIPRVGYLFIPQTDQADLPQVDAVDFVSPQNRLLFGLDNRFLIKLKEPDGSTRVVEVFSFTAEQGLVLRPRRRTFADTYLASLQPADPLQAVTGVQPLAGVVGFSEAEERRWSNFVLRVAITPPGIVDGGGTVALDPEDSEIKEASARAGVRLADWLRLTAGYTYDRGDPAPLRTPLEGYVGNLTATLGPAWELGYGLRYDAKREIFLENRVDVTYKTCCWQAKISYTHREGLGPDATATGRTTDDDIRFTVDLLGFKRGGP
jgi:LPS-assembly protein